VGIACFNLAEIAVYGRFPLHRWLPWHGQFLRKFLGRFHAGWRFEE
jgi:hypothetical protein